MSYTLYYYVTDAYIEDTDDEVTGWANGAGDYTTATIAPGTGYWYKLPNNASTFTLPGQVLDAESVTKDVFGNNKFNLVGNPYPMSLNLAKVKTTVTPTTFAKRRNGAVELQVWNGVGYTYYYYVTDAYVEETDDEVTGWANIAGDYVDETGADINYGLWMRSYGADGKVSFFKDAPVAD